MNDRGTERERLLAEINAELPSGVDWRAGALSYVSAEMAKHGREPYTRYLLRKPLAPVSADPDAYQAALQENLAYLCNFVNAFGLLALPGQSRVLDVACGSGWFAQFFARMDYDVHGFDISAEMVDLARRRFREDPQLGGLAGSLHERLFQLDIEREPLPGGLRGSMDAVVLEACTHHFLDPVAALAHLAEGLKEDGLMLVIEGENRTGPLRPEYVAVMREFATLERPYTRAQIEAVLDMAGLPHRRFLGRVNGWFCPEDPRVAALPEVVRGDAAGLNLAVCARTEAALRRVLPHYQARPAALASQERTASAPGEAPPTGTPAEPGQQAEAVHLAPQLNPPRRGWLGRLLRGAAS